MAIQLRQSESVICEAHFHWLSYLIPSIWAAFFSLGLIGLIASFTQTGFQVAPLFWFTLLGYGPLFYVWIRNKTKAYIVTNQRLYVEEGILAKNKVDIPLSKINDISYNQGLFQRLFGSGNLLVFTGNDKPTRIKNLDKSEVFREHLSKCCNSKAL